MEDEEDEDELLCRPGPGVPAAGELEWDAIDTTVGCPRGAPGGHPGGTPLPPMDGADEVAAEEEVEAEDMMLPPIASVVLGYVRLEETTEMATDGTTPRAAAECGLAPNGGSTGEGPLVAGPTPPYAGIVEPGVERDKLLTLLLQNRARKREQERGQMLAK